LRLPLLAAGLFSALATSPALAHPHVLVDARSELVFDDNGLLTAVRQIWRFDDAFSAFASQGLDADGDGTLSTAELQPLAQINVESLKEYDYFTFLHAGADLLAIEDPTEYWLSSAGGGLTLFFTLPLAEPAEIRSLPLSLDTFDPTFFVAFTYVEQDDAVQLVGADAACQIEVYRPTGLDDSTASLLSSIPADGQVPDALMAVTPDLSNGATVQCP
jgi:ABC-type uncharacterized transport system substrate-binding protein